MENFKWLYSGAWEDDTALGIERGLTEEEVYYIEI